MKQKLCYNNATGVWSPCPELRPKQQQFVAPQQRIKAPRRYRADPIPLMPAPELRPHPMRPRLNGQVQGPVQERIPNRPVMPQPNLPRMPAYIRQQAKHGRYAVIDDQPKVLPKANLPKLHSFNSQQLMAAQQNINRKIRHRSGALPDGYNWYRGRLAESLGRTYRDANRVRRTDLALNKVKGSNSPLLNFGSHLGRTLQAF